jgi:hypothetical protein
MLFALHQVLLEPPVLQSPGLRSARASQDPTSFETTTLPQTTITVSSVKARGTDRRFFCLGRMAYAMWQEATVPRSRSSPTPMTSRVSS